MNIYFIIPLLHKFTQSTLSASGVPESSTLAISPWHFVHVWKEKDDVCSRSDAYSLTSVQYSPEWWGEQKSLWKMQQSQWSRTQLQRSVCCFIPSVYITHQCERLLSCCFIVSHSLTTLSFLSTVEVTVRGKVSVSLAQTIGCTVLCDFSLQLL